MQNNIHRQAEHRESPLYRGTQPAPYSIPFHRTPQNFAHRKAYARPLIIVTMPIKGRYVPRKILSALLIHRLKIRMLQQS